MKLCYPVRVDGIAAAPETILTLISRIMLSNGISFLVMLNANDMRFHTSTNLDMYMWEPYILPKYFV